MLPIFVVVENVISRRVTPVKQSHCLEPPEVDRLLAMPVEMSLPDGGMHVRAAYVSCYACCTGRVEVDRQFILDRFLTVVAVSGGCMSMHVPCFVPFLAANGD